MATTLQIRTGEPLSGQLELRAERDAALHAARAALGNSTRLTRLLTTLGEPGTVDALLNRTVTTLSELFGADIVALLTPADADTCSILAAIGFPEDMLGPAVPCGPGTALSEALTGEAPIARSEPGADDWRLLELGVETTLWVPMRDSHAAVVGVIMLGRCTHTPFAVADVSLLVSMAYRVGLAVEQAQRSQQLERLAQSSHAVAQDLQESVILRETVRMLPEVLRAHAAIVFLVGQDGAVRAFAQSGFTDEEVSAWVERKQVPLAASVLASGEPYQMADLSTDLAHRAAWPTVSRLRSMLAVPLTWGGCVQGGLVGYRFTHGEFSPDGVQLATLYASQVAATLENARLLQAVRDSDNRYRAMIGGVSEVIAILSEDGSFRYLSPAAESAWSCELDQLLGSCFLDHLHPSELEAARGLLIAARAQPGATVTGFVRVRHPVDGWRHFEVSVTDQLADPAVAGIIATYHDVTERKAFEQELSKLAFRDPLSGLANRRYFTERLEDALVRANRESRSVGVLFIDLDNFKIINDSLGHAVGDLVLGEVATRLKECLRAGDTAARIGGDEFTVLIECGDPSATLLAERLQRALAAPIHLPSQDVFATASIGIALSVPHVDNAEDLLRKADLAMYRAKSSGKAQHRSFDVSLDASARERLQLETDLRAALERAELEVYYQPIVSLDDERVYALEALVRWNHPTRGLIVPDQFIPLAEETGLIVPIGEWVLEQACTQVHRWNIRRRRDGVRRLRLNVNLSPRQFQSALLVSSVSSILERTGLEPGLLVLEITETALMGDAADAVRTTAALKGMGISLAIDDFGTGYSSLGHLKRFTVDVLKIDRSFVSGLGQDPQDSAIVRSVVALADGLGLEVTAEGIETAAQLAQLRALDCHWGQGYLFARPASAAAIQALLEAEWQHPARAHRLNRAA